MEIPVYGGGQLLGSAAVQQVGLYTQIAVTVATLPEGIWRAYGCTDTQRVLLGVLTPEEEGWRVTKRLPTAALQEMFQMCDIKSDISDDESEAKWEPFTELLLGCELTGAKYRTEQAGKTIILPYDPQISCALVPLFCFFSMTEVDGKPWILLRLDENGDPRLPT